MLVLCLCLPFPFNAGLGPTLLRNIPANSIYLGSYEVFKQQLAERQGVPVAKLPLIQNFMAGGVAGM